MRYTGEEEDREIKTICKNRRKKMGSKGRKNVKKPKKPKEKKK
ncbi:hypothetical protein ACFLUD_01310 [Chloroflexota bacterium]